MLTLGELTAAVAMPRSTRTGSVPSALRPIWELAIGWILLVPMFYFAANGTFIPQSGYIDAAATAQAPGSDAAHKISVMLISLICILLIAFRFSQVFALAQRTKIIMAFPVLAVASCWWSVDPLQSIVSGSILMIFTSFAIYVGSRLSFQRQFELIMMVGAVALPASVALALLVPSIGVGEAGWRGIFGHKQACAAVSTLFLVTALHWKCLGLYQRMFRVFCVGMCGVLILMSQSRTGWALALVALLLSAALCLLQRLPPKEALAMTLLAFVAAVAVSYTIYTFSSSILVSVGKDSTLNERTIIWAAAWDAAVKRPILGYGFGAFWKGLYGPSQAITLIAGWGLHQAQNGFLDVCLEMGAVGVALIVIMTGQAIRNAVICFHSMVHKTYIRWCIVVIVCTLLYNIGESSVGLVNITWFLFLLALIGLSQLAANMIERPAIRGDVDYLRVA